MIKKSDIYNSYKFSNSNVAFDFEIVARIAENTAAIERYNEDLYEEYQSHFDDIWFNYLETLQNPYQWITDETDNPYFSHNYIELRYISDLPYRNGTVFPKALKVEIRIDVSKYLMAIHPKKYFSTFMKNVREMKEIPVRVIT